MKNKFLISRYKVMETEAKYYTPSLEEFFVGFEFEHFNYEGKLVSGSKWNRQEWHKEICEADWFNILLDEYEHDEEAIKNYRVKYLTAEDIESLGFVKHGVNMHFIYTDFFNMDVECVKNNCPYRLYVDYGKHKVMIKYPLSDGQILFDGKIKNLSELKQVLKMIGVTK